MTVTTRLQVNAAETPPEAVPSVGTPLAARLSHVRYERLTPKPSGWRGLVSRMLGLSLLHRTTTAWYLEEGIARAAVVMQLDPLLVAAYSDELDAVLMLRWPTWLVEAHRLETGARLLTINAYEPGRRVVADITPGPRANGQCSNMQALIADFYTDDAERLAACRVAITEEEWQRCETMGRDHLERFNHRARCGGVGWSALPIDADES